MSDKLTPIPKDTVVQIDSLVQWSQGHQVIDQQSYEAASHTLRDVQIYKRKAVEHFKQFKDPLNAHRKTLLSLEKDATTPLVDAEQRLIALIVAYERTHQDAVEAHAKDVLNKGSAELAPVLTIPKGQKSRVWETGVIVDFQALVAAVAAGSVPLDVLKPNQVALDKIVKAQGAFCDIPGVTVETRKTVYWQNNEV